MIDNPVTQSSLTYTQERIYTIQASESEYCNINIGIPIPLKNYRILNISSGTSERSYPLNISTRHDNYDALISTLQNAVEWDLIPDGAYSINLAAVRVDSLQFTIGNFSVTKNISVNNGNIVGTGGIRIMSYAGSIYNQSSTYKLIITALI